MSSREFTDFEPYHQTTATNNALTRAFGQQADTKPATLPVRQHAPLANTLHLSPEEQKAENVRKAALLRAKLLAQRQNTPMKQTMSRTNTPAQHTPAANTPAHIPNTSNTMTAADTVMKDNTPSDVLGLDSLLAEGKAAAAQAEQNKVNGTRPTSARTTNNFDKPAAEHVTAVQTQPNPPSALSDPYYADLPAWLELTGFHDVAFRTSKLHTFNEKRALEEEVARIQAKLDKLCEAEQASVQTLRASIGPQATAGVNAPPLPSNMPSKDAAFMADVAREFMATPAATNGTKRSRSPEPIPVNTRRRQDDNPGYRIRGANDSPPGPRRVSPRPMERRISYPEVRRSSYDMQAARSRDPSLERRQNYYRRDGEPAAIPPPQYDQYIPRGPPHARPPYERGNGPSNYRAAPCRGGQLYNGSAGLDLKKGGQSALPSRRV